MDDEKFVWGEVSRGEGWEVKSGKKRCCQGKAEKNRIDVQELMECATRATYFLALG